MASAFGKYNKVVNALFEMLDNVISLIPDFKESELQLSIRGESSELKILVSRTKDGRFSISINQIPLAQTQKVEEKKEEVKEEKKEEVTEEIKEKEELPELPEVEVSFEQHKL